MHHQPPGADVFAHVYNRGVKKLPIYRDKSDLLRLLLNLFYFNHSEPMPDHWKRELEELGDPSLLQWPDAWGKRNPLVSILAFSIMDNHLHLLIKENVDRGISRFMHRVSMGYSKFINEKYHESGSLFQGTFKSRLIEKDADIRNLAVYVMVKNPFELYAGGLTKAIKHFDDAYEDACASALNSLGTYAGNNISPIIAKDLLGELFDTPASFKEFAREIMVNRLDQLEAEFD